MVSKKNFIIKGLFDYFFIEIYVVFVFIASFVIYPDRWFVTCLLIIILSGIIRFAWYKYKKQK